MPRIKNWSVLTLFFISGFSGLIYQILWMRQFKYLLGSSIVSVSIIVAVFMLGLLVGSWWIGKKLAENKISDELKLYGKLELIIGVYGLLLLIILPNSKSLFALLGQPTLSFNVVRLIYNIVLTTILLVIPTAAMGATLPLLVSYFSKQSNTFRKTTAQFYSINALGGAFAAVLTGFFFIKSLGVNNSLVIAIILNVFIGLIVLILSRSSKTNIPTLKNEEINTGKAAQSINSRSNFFLIAAFTTGFISIAYEVLWIRCLNYLLNSSTYTFAIVLGIFLFGISFGSILVSFLKRVVKPLILVGIIQFVLSLASVGIIYLFYEYAYSESFSNLFIISNGLESNWYENVGLNFIFSLIVFLIPAVLMGMSFPLISDLYYRAKGEVPGQAISKIYVFNTLGCILGALIPVFIFIPAFGSIKTTLYVLAVLNLLLALYFFLKIKSKYRSVLVGVLFALFTLITGILPSGEYLASLESIGEDNNADRPIFYKEGIMATVKVYNKEGKYKSMSIDGVTIASEDFKQKESIIGHLPFLTNASVKEVLVVGLASGSTIGSILKHDEVENLDVVEIVPSVIKGADFFKTVNGDVNNHPKVDIYIDDIYSFLSYSKRQYDLISSDGKFGVLNKSNTTMLSKDYYEQCYEHLAENGIFVQWISTQIPNAHLKTVLATTASVFPFSELFLLRKNLFILSSKTPVPMSSEQVLKALNNPTVAADLSESGVSSPQEMLSAYIGTNNTLGTLNTFDTPVLEYDYITERKKDIDKSRTSDFRNFEFLKEKYLESEQAISESKNTITNNENYISFNSNRKFWGSRHFFFLANHALLDGKKADALKGFSEVVSINHSANGNDIAVSAKHIGVFNLDTKRYRAAIKYFDVATKKVPGYSNAYTLKGVSYYYLNEFDSSRMNFASALELNPNDQTAQEFLTAINKKD